MCASLHHANMSHAGSDLPPNLPPCCCRDRLWWARAGDRRFAASPCGDHAPGAPARAAATCHSCLAANTLATAASCRSVAWFPAARAPLLRPHECLSGSVRTGRSGLYVRHTRRTNGGAGANSAQSRHCRPPCADRPVTAAAVQDDARWQCRGRRGAPGVSVPGCSLRHPVCRAGVGSGVSPAWQCVSSRLVA
jgi:hypothetical protein